MLRIVLVPVLATVGLAAAGEPAEPVPSPASEPFAARVNGETIGIEVIEQRLAAMHRVAADGERSGFDVDRLVNRLVNDALLAQEARAIGMHTEDPIASKVERQRRELALALLEQEEVLDRAVPGDEEIRTAFEDLFRRATLSVVTVDDESVARATLEELRAGAEFDAIARERSLDPYALRGGRMQAVDRRDLQPEIAALAFSLEAGELAGPVRTDLGWSVIRVEKLEPADPQRLDEVRGWITGAVRQQKLSTLRRELAGKAREEIPVVIDEELARSLRIEPAPDGRPSPVYDDGDAVLVRIGDSGTITMGEFGGALLDRWARVRNLEAARASAPIVLDRLVEERVILALALRRGYGTRPEVRKVVRERETELLVRRYLEQVVAEGIEVTEPEMRAHFAEHEQEFRRPPQVKLGRITVASEEEATRIAALLKDGAELAWLAERHSLDNYKSVGGDTGWTTVRPGPDELQNLLLRAKPGDVLGPFAETDTYVVYRVTARRETGTYTFEEVGGTVRERVFAQKFGKALESYMDKLRERSEIEINEDLLAALQLSGTVEQDVEQGAGGHGH